MYFHENHISIGLGWRGVVSHTASCIIKHIRYIHFHLIIQLHIIFLPQNKLDDVGRNQSDLHQCNLQGKLLVLMGLMLGVGVLFGSDLSCSFSSGLSRTGHPAAANHHHLLTWGRNNDLFQSDLCIHCMSRGKCVTQPPDFSPTQTGHFWSLFAGHV